MNSVNAQNPSSSTAPNQPQKADKMVQTENDNVSNCVFIDLPKSYSSHKRCIVCFKYNSYQKLYVIPSEARVQALIEKNIFIPDQCRTCGLHLNGNRFKKEILDLIVPYKREVKMTKQSIEELVKCLIEASKKNSLFDEFSNTSSLDDETCKSTTGFSKNDFEIILSHLTDLNDSSVRTKSQALSIYLFWLKTGLNQESIKAYFKLNNRVDVSRYCEQIRKCLLESFVPEYLGCKNLNRAEWLEQNSLIVKELFSLKDDQFAVVADGNYS